MGKLNLFSDFLQGIGARAVPFAASIQKPLALTQEGRMTLPRADGDLPIFRAERKLVGQFVDPRVAPQLRLSASSSITWRS